MLYVERKPAPPLAPFIRALWYSRAPGTAHARERILPSGCVEVILNLARDFFMDCPENAPEQPSAPALIVGARSIYEIVDTSDMASLIGIHFQPGGFAPFIGDSADRFTNRSLPLEDLWGPTAGALRDRLRELSDPGLLLMTLESFLMSRFTLRRPRHPMVEFGLARFAHDPHPASVHEIARSSGWSERRFSQVFREEVGLSPKAWMRIQRFQSAVRRLHAGVELRWADLALACGFYDQSHFANEFRAFSGIDVTTYSAQRTRWANHVSAD